MNFHTGEKCWSFMSNMINDCPLDIISPYTTFLHHWEVGEMLGYGACIVKCVIGMVEPRRALLADLYPTKEDALFSMKQRLEELAHE